MSNCLVKIDCYKRLYIVHFLGFRWPPLRWPGVANEPPFRFRQKRMLIQIGLCPMNEGVRWPPPLHFVSKCMNEGVEASPRMQSVHIKK